MKKLRSLFFKRKLSVPKELQKVVHKYPEAPHPYSRLEREDPPLDYATFGLLIKTAAIWTFSLTVFGFMMGTLGYSYWWHQQRERAKKAGVDLDKWYEEFEKTDPVVQWLKKTGLQK